MASPLCSLLFLLFVSDVFLLSISAFDDFLGQDSKTHQKGFRLVLFHRDLGKNLTKPEFLKRALRREKFQLQRFRAIISTNSSSFIVKSPVNSDSVGGEYIAKFAFGTPSHTYNLVFDTGSDLIWIQCKPCNPCIHQPSPTFDPTSSSTYKILKCTDPYCRALSASCDSKKYCSYGYSYGSGFATQGLLSSETFSFPSGSSYPNMVFGCATSNQGGFPTKVDGLVGVGNGPVSLVSQFSSRGYGPRVLSYCLVPFGSRLTGSFYIGLPAYKLPNNVSSSITIPMNNATKTSTFTYIDILSMSVGKAKMATNSIFELSGGCIMDSGTTLTVVPTPIHKFIQHNLDLKVRLRLVQGSSSAGLDMCWYKEENVSFPDIPITLYFFKDQKWVIPSSSYLVEDTYFGSKVICTAFADGTKLGTMFSIVGNLCQQRNVIRNDLEKFTVAIAGLTDCSSY